PRAHRRRRAADGAGAARMPGAAEPLPVPEAALPGCDGGSRSDRQRPDRIGPGAGPRGPAAFGDRAPAPGRTATAPGGTTPPPGDDGAATGGAPPARPARTAPDGRRQERLLTPFGARLPGADRGQAPLAA